MFGLLIPVVVVLGGIYFFRKESGGKGLSIFAPKGHPVPGLPKSGPGSPVGLTPPGINQPPGQVISLPPVTNPSPALSTAAAALMQGLQNGGVTRAFSTMTQAFQSAFNASASPTVPLKVDGEYGPKCQAALQSVVAPAIAPQASSAHPVVVPSTPAAQPNPAITDPTQAASDLITFFSGGAKKGSIAQVATFQNAWNTSPQNTPLVVDGKYGSMTQAALQGVLTWMGSSQPAPKNPYGAVKAALLFVPPANLSPTNLASQAQANAAQSALNAITGQAPGQS